MSTDVSGTTDFTFKFAKIMETEELKNLNGFITWMRRGSILKRFQKKPFLGRREKPASGVKKNI